MASLVDDLAKAQQQDVNVSGNQLERDLERATNPNNVALSYENAQSSGLSPDDVARAKNLSGTLGIPQSLVEEQLPDAQRIADRQKIVNAASKNTGLAAFLSDPSNMKLAHDDVDALDAVTNAVTRGAMRIDQMFTQWRAEQSARISKDQSRTFEQILADEMPDTKYIQSPPNPVAIGLAAMRKLQASLSGVMGIDQAAAADELLRRVAEKQAAAAEYKMSAPAQWALDSLKKDGIAGWGVPISEAASRAWNGLTGLNRDEAVGGVKDLLGSLGSILALTGEVGLESAPQLAASAPMSLINPAAGVAVLGATSYATERYTSPTEYFQTNGIDISKPEGRAKILDNPQIMAAAQQYGITRGAIIGAFDALSAGIAGKTLATNPAANMILQGVVQAAMDGGGEAGAQLATTGKIDSSEVILEAIAGLATAPAEVGMMALNSIKNRSDKAATMAADAAVKNTVADQTISSLDNIRAATEASKTNIRSPNAYADFLRMVADKTGIGDVYVNARKFVEYYQDDNAYKTGIVDPNELEIAYAHDTDVKIPLSDFMTKVDRAGFDFLKEHAKYTEDGFTHDEAVRFRENIDEVVREQGEDFVSRMQRDLAEATPYERIYQDVVDKLVKVGRPRMEAEAHAHAARAMMRMLSDKTRAAGLSHGDVWDFYQRFPYLVQGDRAIIEPKDIGQLDYDIAALNARIGRIDKTNASFMNRMDKAKEQGRKFRGRNAPRDLPVISELIKLGGIRPNSPIAAELKAMDVTRKTHPRLFNKDGLGDIDNFPKGEGRVWDVLPEEAGYVSRDAILNAINDELSGRPITMDDAAKADIKAQDERLDQLEQYLDELGLKPSDPIDKIKSTIEADMKRRDEDGIDYYGSVFDQEAWDGSKLTPWNEPKITVDGVERHAVNSDGKPIAATKEGLENFWRWFGDSKVVDADGKPLVVYSGHANAELYGDQYDPKKGTAGGFYATEAPNIASNYSLSKMGVKENYENGDQYRFQLKNGKWGKKLWQLEFTPEQQEVVRNFVKDLGYDIDQYWKDNKSYDRDARNAIARGGVRDSQSVWRFLESMGDNIAYAKSGDEPMFMRQQKGAFEDLLDKLGIKWQSYDWQQPAVMPLYLSIKNVLNAEHPFPKDLLSALEKKASRERRQGSYDDQWTKEMTLKEWVGKIKSGDEYWTTQVPKTALPILKEHGFDGIQELGMKGATNRTDRQINWIAFDPTQIKSVFNRGTFSKTDPRILFQRNEKPSFYSALQKSIDSIPQGKGDSSQWEGIINNLTQKGVKNEEIEWSGVRDWLKQQKGSVTKQQVMDYLRANDLQIKEVMKGDNTIEQWEVVTPEGRSVMFFNKDKAEKAAEKWGGEVHAAEPQRVDDTKFSKYTLAGGENYRELLLTLPNKEVTEQEARSILGAKPDAQLSAADIEYARKKQKEQYRSSHYDEPNIVAHLRFNDRNGSNGERILHIEEIQSDWHQAGRKKGYDTPPKDLDVKHEGNDWNVYNNGNIVASVGTEERAREIATTSPVRTGVPDAPFKTSWPELAFKRALMYAVEHGYDKVTWTTGEQQAERYDLRKQIKEIEYIKRGDKYELSITQNNGDGLELPKSEYSADELEDVVGKEVAKKIVDGEGKKYRGHEGMTLEGLDLKVGGEGMKGFYDNMLPKMVNKLVKKWGGKVGDSEIEVVAPHDGKVRVSYTNNESVQQTRIFESRKEAQEWVRDNRGQGSNFRILNSEINSKVHSLEITPEMRTAISQGMTLFQSDLAKQGANASYRPSDRWITLGRNANASSFIHEIGHDWLELMGNFSEQAKSKIAAFDATKTQDVVFPADLMTESQVEAARSIIRDYKTVLRYLGVEKREDIKVEHHEKWARSIESYFLEGKAPSEELKSAMERLKRWMLGIYLSLKDFNKRYGVELNPEIRDVMDRMLATDEQIKESQENYRLESEFQTEVTKYMSPNEAKNYARLRSEATQRATHDLLEQVMKPIRQAKLSWWKQEREAMKARVEKQIAEKPEWNALLSIRDKENEHRISIDDANLTVGAGAKDVLPRGVLKKDGISVELAAQMYGYRSGKELIDALASLKDVKFSDVVEAETDRQMRVKHGDPLNDGTIVRLAEEVIHNEKRAAVIEMEYKALLANGGDEFIRKAAERRVVKEGALDTQSYKSEASVADTAEAKIMAMQSGDVAGIVTAADRSARAKMREADAMVDSKAIKGNASRVSFMVRMESLNKTYQYAQAELRAANESRKAIAKKDFGAAAMSKYRQLVNHFMFLEMRKRQDEVAKANKKISILKDEAKDFAKSYGVDHMKAAQWVMSQYGLREPPMEGTRLYEKADFDAWRNGLMDFEQTEASLFLLTADAGAKSWKELSIGEYLDMADGLKNILAVAKRVKEFEIEGKRYEKDAVIAELVESAGKYAKKDRSVVGGKYRAVSQRDAERRVEWLHGIDASTRRVEALFDMYASGDVTNAWMDFFIRNTEKADAGYRSSFNETLGKLKSLVDPFVEDFARPRVIIANELVGSDGIPFGFENFGELMMAVLHTGNASNKSKLLVGRGWGHMLEDGTLDTSKWDSFIKRMYDEKILRKEHMDLAQAIWDLNESIKPAAQKAFKEVHGYNFSEITAEAFSTPFGEYRGGYIPAKIDRSRSVDGKLREAKDVMEGVNQTTFPATGRGFTHQRIEQYREALSLNIMELPNHVEEVIRFSHYQPTISKLARVAMDKGFQREMQSIDPVAVNEIIVPWLNRVAHQQISTPSSQKWMRRYDKILTKLRTNVGMQMLAGNWTNIAQQYFGVVVARSKVDTKYLASAASKYAMSPLETGKAIGERSEFMRNRMHDDSLNALMDLTDVFRKPSKVAEWSNIIKRNAYFLQSATQRQVDITVWTAAYDQGIAKGLSETDAVFQADHTVRMTQGGNRANDLSAFEAGTPAQRLFSQFFNYQNTMRNLLQSEAGKSLHNDGISGVRKAGQLAFIYSFVVALPAILSAALTAALSGRLKDEPEDVALDVLLNSQFKYVAGMVPFAGAATVSAMNTWNDKWYDDRLNLMPVMSAAEPAIKAPKAVWQAFFNDGSVSEAVRDVSMAVGLATGLPIYQFGSKPASYLAKVNDGRASPEDWVDMMQGLLTGKDGTERK